MGKGYEDLEVWQRSKKLAVDIHILTRSFPVEDRYSLTSQMRRAAISVPSNLAEGATRQSKKEFKRFIQIAHGSCSELRTQLMIAYEIGNLDEAQYLALGNDLQIIGRMLKALERSIKE